MGFGLENWVGGLPQFAWFHGFWSFFGTCRPMGVGLSPEYEWIATKSSENVLWGRNMNWK